MKQRKLVRGLKKIFKPQSPLYSLLLGLMSFVAVLVSLLTLKEMQKQRELTMIPIVYPQKFNNQMMFIDTLCSDIYREQIYIEQNGSLESNIKEWLNLGLINVGQGSALDVDVEWQVNYDNWIQLLDTLALDEYLFGIKKFDQFVSISYQKCGNGYATSSNLTTNSEYSHLLSVNQDTDGIQIPIPSQLVRLPIAMFKANWHKYGQTISNVDVTHNAEHQLHISYSGINGEKYNSTFSVNIDLYCPSVSYKIDSVIAPANKFMLRISVEK